MYKISSVLVLLSTYNGEKFLSEQLDSLLNQINVNIHLLIRDDGSCDSTELILQKYSSKFSNVTIINGKNVGCKQSYCLLIDYAYNNLNSFDYYAFCDQDDVWEIDKLYIAVTKLNEISNSKKLYTSSYYVVDEKLKKLYIKVIKYRHTVGEALMMINTLGCTQVYSEEIFRLSAKRIKVPKSNISKMPNHDGWLYLISIINNAEIIYDETPHILYRQHQNNVVGANKSSIQTRFFRILASRNIKSEIAKILLELDYEIDKKTKVLLSLNSNYKKSFKTKFKLLFSKDMITNSISVNIAYRLLILTNYF